MKKLFSAVLVVLLFVAGCTAKDKEDTVRIVLDWTPNTNHTGLYVAVEKGYFKDAGVNVEIVQPPEGSTTSLVGAGGAPFGISFQDTLAPAFAQKEPIPVTAVAALVQHNTSGIVSLKSKGIERPRDLENHVYATWDAPVEQAIIRKVMTDDGGDFNALSMIPNTVVDAVSALQSDVDAIWIFEGWDGVAMNEKGLETNFINFADYGKELDYYSPVLIANNEYLKNNKAQATQVVQAIKKGYEYAIQYPEEAAQILMKEVPEMDEALIIASQKFLSDRYQADANAWGAFDQERWDAFYAWLYENKLIDHEIPAQFGFTNEYVEH